MGLLDKAKDAAKTVGDKAQEGLKAGQAKLDETKTKREINERKEAIGGLVYAQRTGAAPPDAEAQITRLVDEIKDHEAQLADRSSGEDESAG